MNMLLLLHLTKEVSDAENFLTYWLAYFWFVHWLQLVASSFLFVKIYTERAQLEFLFIQQRRFI